MNELHLQTNVRLNRSGAVRRRDFLKVISAAGLAAGALPWTDVVTASAAELRKQGKACILLWMQGGPSQFETFSPKPGHANGGETKAISTSVSGIEYSENLPELANVADKLCLVRSMTSKEGSHPRATYLLHTGYLPTATVRYPTLGSIVAHEIAPPRSELPSFVRIGGRFGGGSDNAGLLGIDWDAFVLGAAGRPPENTALTTSQDRYRRRLNLVTELEQHYAASGGKQEVADHQKVYAQAAKMVTSPKMEAFDLSKEPASARESYGTSPFASGCLLARRLVETGVTFVEVNLGNWDTHQDNAERTKTLCGQLDTPFAALVKDLADRDMLDKTLVIWLGEFGRTPRINPRAGRDHYPRAFDAVLAGGGVKGGQIIGRTDESGASVADRPVTVNDLFRTICHSLAINANKENMSSIGRPIKIVDGGAVVEEVFG
jgi:uncharacterized protein (DUF1501 family)